MKRTRMMMMMKTLKKKLMKLGLMKKWSKLLMIFDFEDDDVGDDD
jgi:hypothetical protein